MSNKLTIAKQQQRNKVNRTFTRYLLTLCQNEASCETNDMVTTCVTFACAFVVWPGNLFAPPLRSMFTQTGAFVRLSPQFIYVKLQQYRSA